MSHRAAALLFAIVGAVGASVAHATEPWEDQLREQTQLKSASEYADMATKGYTLIDVAKTSVLDASASELVPVTLPTGGDYIIMGVCDNDCLDLDLAIIKNGAELSKDATDDDWPLVEVAGGGSGYQIKVSMYQCSTPNCGYQLTVWRRDQASPTPAASGTEWQDQLRQQTEIKSGSEYASMASKGYSLAEVAQTSLLEASASETVSLNLSPGREYIVMGVCDNDCQDLDLSLIKGGIELSTDTTDDDWPLVEITPTSSADYKIKVTMYQCSTTSCGYQLTVWQK
ncbi:MAG: hypothetical protein ACI8S6_003297 [Myxococcota bacterium]|jgi:hypothetical protein